MSRFLDELKRRRVVRAALLYTGAAFLALQAVDLFVEAFQLPPVVFATVGIAAIVGLPVAVVLAWAFDVEPTHPPGGGQPAPALSTWLSARSLVAVVVLVAFGVLLGLAPRYFFERDEAPSDPIVRRYEILLPEQAPIEFIGSSPLAVPLLAMAITPDGNRLVYAGTAEGDRTRLYVRELSDFEVRPLPGSEGAYAPFVSPDGRAVGFFAHDQLRVVPIDGGEARIIAETPNPLGGAWWGDDRIIYNDHEGNAHWWVTVNGGAPTRLYPGRPDDADGATVTLGLEYQPLRDGRRFLVFDTAGRVAVYAPATGELQTVMELPVNVRIASDALVYAIGNDLLALDFDPERAVVSGDARLVGSGLRRDGPLAQYVVSDRTLIYATGAPYGQRYLVLVDRDGGAERLEFPPARYMGATFSPDGRQLAITVIEGQGDVWVYDLETAQRRRLTRGGFNNRPHWSSDGRTIYFSSNRHGDGQTSAIYRTSQSSLPGDGEPVLEHDQNLFIAQLHSSDRATISLRSSNMIGDLYLADLRRGEIVPATTRRNIAEELGHLSPDGRWLALTVDASGRYEVIVQALDDENGPRIQVTTEGGEEPLWAPDMSELFYRYGSTLYAVSVSFEGGGPVFGRPAPVFDDPTWENIGGFSYWRNPADGRFLILRANQPPTSRSLRVVEGWRSVDPPGR